MLTSSANMQSIAEQQRGILAVLRQQPLPENIGPDTSAWLDKVSRSTGLVKIREIGQWWLRFQIETQCRYTSRLMKRFGCFEQAIEAHFSGHPAPPSIEELSTDFLTSVQSGNDPLLSAVAAFELACIASRTALIEWDRNPSAVLSALNHAEPLPPAEMNARYTMQLSPHLPGGVSCTREADCAM